MLAKLKNMRYLFKPSYWIMNNAYSKELDEYMINLAYNNKFESVSSYRAKLGGVSIWIENHPYASMIPENLSGVRPSRRTIEALHKKYIKDTLEAELAKTKIK